MRLVSMMLCSAPAIRQGRLILSACDSVWEPIVRLPASLRRLVTDELGNPNPEYGGFLFPRGAEIFSVLHDHQLFACVRGVRKEVLKLTDSPLAADTRSFPTELKLVGWDVVTGNGWVSAALEGLYPIDPVDGSTKEVIGPAANKFGLLHSEKDSRAYCALNDRAVPDRAPWYPVAVYLDVDSFSRLSGVNTM